MGSLSLIIKLVVLGLCSAYQPGHVLNRREAFIRYSSAAAAAFFSASGLSQQPAPLGVEPANAFDGGGSSAYSGRTPESRAARALSYKTRITADVKDFNTLGKAIRDGKLEGGEWVYFFAQAQRREADEVGRKFAALPDMVGTRAEGGGCGYLLAASFAKPNKPPENTPAVKKFRELEKAFDPIEAAGKKGDAKKAQASWDKASVLFSDFLQEVGLPADLSDPIYK